MTGSVSAAAFWTPGLETKMPPTQECRIDGTIFVPNNAALTEGGKYHPIQREEIKMCKNTAEVPREVPQK